MTIEEALDYVEDINSTVTWTDEQKVDEAFYDNVKDWLEELQYLRKQSRWIPVTERLPEEDCECLITIGGFANKRTYIELSYFAKDLLNVNEYDFAGFKGKSGFYRNYLEYGDCLVSDVLAWMPIPQPYKEEGAE